MADEVILTTDSRPYKSLITDVGNAKMAQAILEGRKVNIVEMRLGDGGGSYYLPTVEQTALVNEVWSGEIANKSISDFSPNIIAVKAVIPSSVGGFTVREAGLFDDDGDLIAVCNMPEIAKATLPEGISSNLDIVMNILLSNTDAVEFVINSTLDPASRDDLEQAVAAVKEETAQALEEHNADSSAHAKAIKATVQSMVASGELAAGGSQAAVSEITIPAEGWQNVGTVNGTTEDADGDGEAGTDGSESGGLYLDIAVEGVTEDMIPLLFIYQADLETARQCGFSTSVRTLEGVVRVYSQAAPASAIRATLALFGSGGTASGGGSYILQAATATTLGGVKVGDGLSVTEDGTLSVDATNLSEEAAAALVEATTESDENVEQMLDETFAVDRSGE